MCIIGSVALAAADHADRRARAAGLAAVVLIPQGRGLIRDAFPPEEQATAFGDFGPAIGLAAVAGPIVGGALIGADLLASPG